ncbi:MAG: transketolase [Acidimicrobiia bacterium]|nr:transketolase [Acidimicrobiia bacterium]
MRDALSTALVESAQRDERVVVLTGDHGYALFDEFRSTHPDRFINAGIAEQNMVGMAAGMARAGLRPIVYGLSAFIPIRVLEQVKLDIAHDGLPVVLLGDGSGFVYSHLGVSHQSLEDIACARSIPGLRVLSPSDRFEMTAAMRLATGADGPTYLRIGKADLGDVHPGPIEFDSGELLAVRSGPDPDITFIATGSMVTAAMEVADHHFPGAGVWSAPSIKPLDEASIERIAASTGALVVMEEHSTIGGLGSAIAEILSVHSHPPLLRIGSADRFSDSCGSYQHLRREHGLDVDSVLTRIEAFLARPVGID